MAVRANDDIRKAVRQQAAPYQVPDRPARGTVFIASKNMRGEWAPKPVGRKCATLDVTSAQSLSSPARLDFSPMTAFSYKGFYCFENYWQAGKVYAGVDRAKQLKWWLQEKKPHRRYPGSRGVKVQYAVFAGHGDKRYGYIESRKEVYVPEYYALVKDRNSVAVCRERLSKGENVVVYDFDGPREAKTGKPLCLPLTKELLKEKINDPAYPFGHGYVVAAMLLGLTPSDYV
jgi:hypothetical protein